MGTGWKFKLQAKFNMLGPDIFPELNSKHMKDKYTSYDNIFMDFLIAGPYEEILLRKNPSLELKAQKVCGL